MPPRAAVFNHFSVPKDNGRAGNCRATCRHCGVSVCGSIKATSNFRRHLQRKHPDILKEIDSNSSPPQTRQPLTPNLMPDMSLPKWHDTDPRQRLLTNGVIDLITKELLPLSFVESPSFRKLIHTAEPSFSLPSTKHLRSHLLPQRSAAIRAHIKLQMEQAMGVCLTVCLWSNRDHKSFVGIIGHFILEYKLHSVMLTCRHLKDMHSAESIFRVYEETINKYETANRISTIVSSRAISSVKEFTLLPDVEDVPSGCQDEIVVNKEDMSTLTDEFAYYLPPPHNLCFSQALQLVIHEALQGTSLIKQVITKVSRLVTYCRKSAVANNNMEEYQKQQQPLNRWNDQLKILRSLVQIPAETLNQLDIKYKLTLDEIRILGELCEIFEPFEEVADRVQGERTSCSSLVIICVRGLRQALATLRDTHDTPLLDSLQFFLERHLYTFETMEHFRMAAVLDPRFKIDWCHDEEVKELRNLLTEHVTSLSPELPVDYKSPALTFTQKRSKLFSFMDSRATSVTQFTNTFVSDVDEYLSQPCLPEDADPLAYWKDNQLQLPLLAKLASKYLAIPASSASVSERFFFGMSGNLFSPDKSNLSDAWFEELMFIRSNSG